MNGEINIRTRRAALRARERQKRKLMLAGGLIIVLLLVIILAVFVFGSCGKYDTDTSTVYVLENGKVISTSVEAFDEEKYDKGQLKDYIKETINTYNSENGKGSIKQKSFAVKDNMASLVMQYADASVFGDFEGIELFNGTLEEAKEAGYTFEGVFARVSDGVYTQCSVEDFMNESEYKVVIIKANTKVCVENSEICYVSTENVASVGEDYVVIKGGSVLSMTQEDAQQVEAVETTEGADGAVGEDELEIGTESTEMQFDFGEKEAEDDKQYTNVYTYIIYK